MEGVSCRAVEKDALDLDKRRRVSSSCGESDDAMNGNTVMFDIGRCDSEIGSRQE